jgi:hypothetical protein
MNDTPTTFENLLVRLARAEVAFLTVGGVACALCGFVRTTEDVGILVARTGDNLERLLVVLRGFGQGYARELTVEDFADEEGSIRVVEDFPLDIFVRLRGHRFEDLVLHRRWHDLQDVRIPYLAPAGLLLLKSDSTREKDRIDVVMLRRLVEEEAAAPGS